MKLLATSNLKAAYGTTPILHNVSIEVEPEGIVGVIGRNGVGKTTLMRTIIGEIQPSDGEIQFLGDDMTNIPPHQRARMGMGYVPQNKNLFPRMTVEENLKMGGYINESNERKLYKEVYSYFPVLKERKSQRARTMSGGEQQMLSIARALVGNPKLLLLDEPSEGVQPSIISDISDRIQEINKDLGTTILFVEQNMELAREMSDTCHVMEKGEIIDELAPEEINDSEIISKYFSV